MRVIGVDPGLARTGVAVVEGEPGALRLVHAGCVETLPGVSDASRLAVLLTELEALCARHRPEAAAVEQLFFASNRTTAMRVAEARGVALCALARAGLDVVEYTPMQVKESVAGHGGAAKPQVGRMVRTLLRVDSIPGPDDVADACAVAITHLHRARMGRAVGARVAASGGQNSSRLAAAVAAAQARQASGR
ncbi:MAG TPA: crossover junction endodeoxyribonuclease RuvC [Candidatus Angelobacter sp.]|jgi:crossover junction endodeoxyribonuclease RuvC|nr:crossover junction endodeoxyribonuclease RuvC [Candidatus Angelobacter sp.]